MGVVDSNGGGIFNVPGDSGTVVTIPDGTFPEGSVVVISTPDNVPDTNQELSSAVVDITVFNSAGVEIQPEEPVEICLESTSDDDDQCLGFLDYSEDPPEWKCEDKCPTKEGSTFCGEADHFTNFALLLGSVGANECNSGASDELIFDAAWKDAVLVASVGAGVCLCCIIIFILLLVVPGADRLVHGRDRQFMREMRKKSSTLQVDSELMSA